MNRRSRSAQLDIFSYWVVVAYDPGVDQFTDVFKSYGKNVAQEKVTKYLSQGVCAVVQHRALPMA
tara:strand:+ start:386 stop:580 length:195 start_codon:yes stop_codon:yes gene_type:complete